MPGDLAHLRPEHSHQLGHRRPDLGEIAARIGTLRVTQEWLVLERDDQIIGFAHGQPLKRLAAFQRATETGMSTSPITAPAQDKLFSQLLRRLTERAYRQAFAGITQPNEASNSFHRSFGFQDAGLYRRVVWKQGSWHDVAWMQLDLPGTAEQDGAPGPTI